MQHIEVNCKVNREVNPKSYSLSHTNQTCSDITIYEKWGTIKHICPMYPIGSHSGHKVGHILLYDLHSHQPFNLETLNTCL